MKNSTTFLIICMSVFLNKINAQSCAYSLSLIKTFDSAHVNWWRQYTITESEFIDTLDLVEGRIGDSVFTNFNSLVTVLGFNNKSIVIELDQMVAYVLDYTDKEKSMKFKSKRSDTAQSLFQSGGWSDEVSYLNGIYTTTYMGKTVRMKLDTILCLIQWVEIETMDYLMPGENSELESGGMVNRTYRYELVQRLSDETKVRLFICENTYVEQIGKSYSLKQGFENFELSIIKNQTK